MSGVRRRRFLAVLAALALGLPGAVTLGPSRAAAADAPTFGTPVVDAVFLSGIAISEPVSLPAGVTRVEALIQTEGSSRTFTTPVSLPGPGSSQLEYRFDTPSGALRPNTVVELGFRLTLSDGTTVRGPTAHVRYEDTRLAWRTLSGAHVRVHWTDGGDAFGRRALQIAEDAVQKATDLLGVTETDPIDFFIYADRTAFLEALGPQSPDGLIGQAFPDIRTLFANVGGSGGDSLATTVIPHELTHIVFGTATDNPYHQPTHWLNEGLAVYLSEGYASGRRDTVTSAVNDGTLMPLTALDGQFPASGDRVDLAYGEAVSAVDFLVRHYSRDALVKLIRSYADGRTDDEAFQAGIGLDVAGFQAAWLADLGAATPSPYGPQPAPPGPVPSGWEGAAPTAGAASPSGPPGSQPATGGGGVADGLVVGVTIVVLFVAVLILAAVLRSRRRRDVPPPPSAGGWG